MNNTINLNSNTRVDLARLIESRLLIQANSGGGKSWAIRRIVEQVFGKVQIIIIDPEGEFTNLREKYDFVLAGKEGEAPAESRSAALLARRLLELEASAIIDLYELHPQERKHFVRLFCEAMVNAPKELWHDVMVVIDEAHIFAPEKGESEALGAVIDLATRGRKRGYCAILATQRLPKLSKDAAAECNNKLIGRASQDIDRKRAAEELGFSTKEQILSLRDLEPGEFYVFGPAITREVTKITIGDVQVKPPPRGVSKKSPPPPTDKIKKILGQLADLPKKAEEEARTVAELRAENSSLKRQMRTQTPIVSPETIQRAIEQALKDSNKRHEAEIRSLFASYNATKKVLTDILKQASKAVDMEVPRVEAAQEPTRVLTSLVKKEIVSLADYDSGSLSGPEQKILNAIAWLEDIGVSEPEQTAVAFLADYTYGGGGFNNPRGALRTKGLVEYRGSGIVLTDTGRSLASIPSTPLTREELHRHVLNVLPGPEQKLLKVLLETHPDDISKEDLAERTGYTFGAGGFNNPCGRLRTLGLVEYPTSGRVRARDILFP